MTRPRGKRRARPSGKIADSFQAGTAEGEMDIRFDPDRCDWQFTNLGTTELGKRQRRVRRRGAC